MKPVEIQHFNGFSFYVHPTKNGKFVSLDISHSVVFPESHKKPPIVAYFTIFQLFAKVIFRCKKVLLHT